MTGTTPATALAPGRSLPDYVYGLMERAQADPATPPIPPEIVNDVVRAKRLHDENQALPEDLHQRIANHVGMLTYDATQFRRIGRIFTWTLVLTIFLTFGVQFYFHMLRDTVGGVKKYVELVRTSNQQVCNAQRAGAADLSRYEEALNARETATLRLNSYWDLLGTLASSLPYAGHVGSMSDEGGKKGEAIGIGAVGPCQPTPVQSVVLASGPTHPAATRAPAPAPGTPGSSGSANPVPGISPSPPDNGQAGRLAADPEAVRRLLADLPPMAPAQQTGPLSAALTSPGGGATGTDDGTARRELRQLGVPMFRFWRAMATAEVAADFLASYILPGFYGLLGACAYVLRTLSFWRRQSLGNMRTLSFRVYYLYMPIGFVAGLAVGWLIPLGPTGSVYNLSPLALAFLAGYGNEVLFSTLDRIVQASVGALGRDPEPRAPPPSGTASEARGPSSDQPAGNPSPPAPAPAPNAAVSRP